MVELRDTMRALFGSRWPEVSALPRQVIAGAMRETGDDNPLSAVLPIAKAMSAAGENPTILLATAVDMSDTPPGSPPAPAQS